MNLKKLYKSIVISPIHGSNTFVTLKETEYTFKSFWKPFYIHIGKWFIFDGASIPRLLHTIGTPMNPWTLPWALFHDFLYRKQYTTREQADQCFNELMIYCKVWFIKRNMFYLWVRMFWFIARKQNKAKK